MKAKIGGGVDPAPLARTVTDLEESQRAAAAKIEDARQDLYARVPREHLGNLYYGRAEEVPEQYREIKRNADSDVEKANEIIRESQALIGPFRALLRSIQLLDSEMDLGALGLSGTSQEIGIRQGMLRSIQAVGQAFIAAGPDLERRLPLDLLATLEENLQQELDFLTRRQRDLRPPEPVVPRQTTARSWGASSLGSSWAPPAPKPIPEPVRLTMSKVADVGAAASELEKLLGQGIAEKVLAAALKLQGPEAERFGSAVRAYAVLAETATSALDYARVGARMFGHPDNKRSHEAREYDRSMVEASRPRQAQSKSSLATELLDALADPDPARAMELALLSGFQREAGLPREEWSFDPQALVNALDRDVLIPLRALYECSGCGGFRVYPDDQRAAMKEVVSQIARAVVTGTYDEWRATHPASAKQLEHLQPDERTSWLSSITRESEGTGGAKLTTREASGTELFWATKVGGPSHAFDTMPHCILSLLGNARTKAIVLDDSRWHQHAARAYMRLLPAADGRKMIYLEGAQIDFPYKSNPSVYDYSARGLIDRRVVEHAIEKARQIGASLVMVGAYAEVARELGARPEEVRLVLHPSGAVIEASDTLGPHDWPQGDTETVFPRAGAYVLSAEKLATL